MIQLKNINKVYENGGHAVKDFNLDINDNEFVVLVGPSGCGKSTTLRMIAGLEEITEGEIFVDDYCINAEQPKDRNIAMVFQNYALYPHMSVYKNLAFGLKMRGIKKPVYHKKIEEAARILEIENLLDRKPKDLSGGQRQRVALGRAIVRETKIFLMDEPLSNLDAKLRSSMRGEIIKIHNEMKATTIYVTHDQTEAMTMANKIVVLNKGEIQQIGTPEMIYRQPANEFVATFMGSPAMNILPIRHEEGQWLIGNQVVANHLNIIHKKDFMKLGIRSEDLVLLDDTVEKERYDVILTKWTVDFVEMNGAVQYIHCHQGEHKMIASDNEHRKLKRGDIISFGAQFDKIHYFDNETGLALR